MVAPVLSLNSVGILYVVGDFMDCLDAVVPFVAGFNYGSVSVVL